MHDYMTLLDEAVNETDSIARHYYARRDVVVQQKVDLSPVTEADQKIERTLVGFFLRNIPDVTILGEEYGRSGSPNGRYRVIIDPIDGTRNFIRGIPVFGTLIAIADGDAIVAGVVSNPIQKERWIAQKGKGALYNQQPIQVSQVQTLADSQAFHGSLYGTEAIGLPVASVLSLLSQTHRQRAFGDFYGHVLVASGAGEFSLDFGLKPWDKAPLKIIVEEAGGCVTNWDGGFSLEDSSLVCSNGLFHDKLVHSAGGAWGR